VPKGTDHPLAEVPKHENVPVTVGAHTADTTAHTPGHTPGGAADHTPGGIADNTAHNSHTQPGGSGGTGGHGGNDTTPTGGTAHGGDGGGVPHQGDGGGIPHQGGGGIPHQGGSGLPDIPDNLGHGGHDGGGPVAPGHDGRPELPPHRDNAHQYTNAERKQIMEYQVHRANDPADPYFKKYYNKLGYRLRADVPDHTGLVPPQLVETAPDVWVPKSDIPPPVPPDYLGKATSVDHTHPSVTQEMRDSLDQAAKDRHDAIANDKGPHDAYGDAKAAHKASPTPETQAALDAAKAHHAPFHEALSKQSEAYGEAVAREHAIPREFPGAQEQKLHGPANGNDQFDQVYKQGDRYVVVEAKSHVTTDLGERRINGTRVSQGTRAYFEDILEQMKKRGENIQSEKDLYEALDEALNADPPRIDYVVVKGADNTGTYAGYTIRRFDLTK
ncbi:hypothetical protein ABZW32_30360, partial [Streptomyces sp. NPDC004667]